MMIKFDSVRRKAKFDTRLVLDLPARFPQAENMKNKPIRG